MRKAALPAAHAALRKDRAMDMRAMDRSPAAFPSLPACESGRLPEHLSHYGAEFRKQPEPIFGGEDRKQRHHRKDGKSIFSVFHPEQALGVICIRAASSSCEMSERAWYVRRAFLSSLFIKARQFFFVICKTSRNDIFR